MILTENIQRLQKNWLWFKKTLNVSKNICLPTKLEILKWKKLPCSVYGWSNNKRYVSECCWKIIASPLNIVCIFVFWSNPIANEVKWEFLPATIKHRVFNWKFLRNIRFNILCNAHSFANTTNARTELFRKIALKATSPNAITMRAGKLFSNWFLCHLNTRGCLQVIQFLFCRTSNLYKAF